MYLYRSMFSTLRPRPRGGDERDWNAILECFGLKHLCRHMPIAAPEQQLSKGDALPRRAQSRRPKLFNAQIQSVLRHLVGILSVQALYYRERRLNSQALFGVIFVHKAADGLRETQGMIVKRHLAGMHAQCDY
jgi:hypothetical protein